MKASKVTQKLHWDELILAALREDIPWEDVSANAVVPEGARGHADLIAKADGVVAGLPVFARTFELLDESAEIVFHVGEGASVKAGDLLAEVTGDMRAVLSGERTALNFLQRMSGIATYTRQTADLLKGTDTVLLDTRKTTPLLRSLEKYAVAVGGGSNHRFNLSDGVLLKDNHIGAAGGVRQAIRALRPQNRDRSGDGRTAQGGARRGRGHRHARQYARRSARRGGAPRQGARQNGDLGQRHA